MGSGFTLPLRLSFMSESQKLFSSISGSVIAHLLLMLLVFLHLAASREDSGLTVRNQPGSPKEVTVMLSSVMKKAEPEVPILPDPPKETKRSFVDTDLNEAEESKPENAKFESDRNTRAASEIAPDQTRQRKDGITSLGRLSIRSTELESSRLQDGVDQRVLETQPKAEPLRIQDAATESSKETFAVKTGSTPMPTAAKPKPVPEKPKVNPADTGIFAKGYSLERLKAEQNGTVSRKGQNAVDAEGTELGKYKKKVRAAIERNWHRLRMNQGALVTQGVLRLRFNVTRAGNISNLKITEDKANNTLKEFTLRAILEAEIPAMPADVAGQVGGSGLEMNYDVIIY